MTGPPEAHDARAIDDNSILTAVMRSRERSREPIAAFGRTRPCWYTLLAANWLRRNWAFSPTPFEADAVPHNPRYKQKNRHHCQNNTDIPPYCRQLAHRLPRGPVLALVNEAGVVTQAVAGSLRVAWVR
jgi:hypothetical protein